MRFGLRYIDSMGNRVAHPTCLIILWDKMLLRVDLKENPPSESAG